MEIEQVKDAVDELGRTWAAFREENDRRAGRNQDALGKMNARMDQLEGAIVARHLEHLLHHDESA